MEKMKKCGEEEIDIKEAFKGIEECKPQEVTTESSRRRRSPEEDGESKKKGEWKKGMWKNIVSQYIHIKL